MEILNKLISIFTGSQSDTQKQITAFYNAFRPKFTAFIHKNFPVFDSNTVRHIYHDAFMELYDKVRAGQLTELTSGVETYLCGIGKYKALKYLRKKRSLQETELTVDEPDEQEDIFDMQDDNRKREIGLKLFAEMDKRCKELLTLYYYLQKDMQEIAVEMNFKNEDSAKSGKLKCLRKIKAALKQKLKMEGLL